MKNSKHRVDALDKEKIMHSYTMVEGGEFADKIETISYEIKMEASLDGAVRA